MPADLQAAIAAFVSYYSLVVSPGDGGLGNWVSPVTLTGVHILNPVDSGMDVDIPLTFNRRSHDVLSRRLSHLGGG